MLTNSVNTPIRALTVSIVLLYKHSFLFRTGSLSVDVSERIEDVSKRLTECAQFTSKLLEFIEVTYQ